MKNKILGLFLLAISTITFSQKIKLKNYESNELQDVRNVKIFTPKGYEKDSILKYPLTIVLGDEHLFDLYIGNTKMFAKADMAPKQIIVGVKMDTKSRNDVSTLKENGGFTNQSERFYKFLTTELIPYIERNYKASPFLTLVGEGRAANFVTYFLKEVNPIFNAYVAINPVLTEHTNSLINSFSLDRYQDIDNVFYIYASSSNFASKIQKDRFSDFQFMLESVKIRNLKSKLDVFTSPNVMSFISGSIPRALTQIFQSYSDISKEEYEENIKDLTPLDAISYLEKKYLNIEYLFGTNIGIRKRDIFMIEPVVIEKEGGKYLKVLGDMILKIYPKSHLGDYYIGLYYEKQGDYTKAQYHYKIGYGKMDPSDPNADSFYQNVIRVSSR